VPYVVAQTTMKGRTSMALCLTQSVPFAGDLVDDFNRLLDEASAWRAFYAGIGPKPGRSCVSPADRAERKSDSLRLERKGFPIKRQL
jgi:hypothetical protein